MVLTLSDAFAEANRSGSKPIYLVELDLGPAVYLRVVDYTAGSMDLLRIVVPLDNIDLYESVSFTAETSNEVTAANIAAGINARMIQEVRTIRAEAVGDVVIVVGLAYASMAIESGDDAAWTEDITRLPKTVRFVSGDQPFGDDAYPNSVTGVNGISATLDPLTRETSIGDIEIEFRDDGVLREYLRRTYSWANRVVRVSVGFHGIDEADFITLGTYRIDDVIPDYGRITVRCLEPLKAAIDKEFVGGIWNAHPIEAAKHILQTVGFTSFDVATFDRTNAVHDGTSHWGVSRDVQAGIKAVDLLKELMTMLGGNLVLDDDGTYRYVAFDQDAPAIRHLTIDEVADFEMLRGGTLAARVTISGQQGLLYSSEEESAADEANGNIRTFDFASDFLDNGDGNGGHPRLESYGRPGHTQSELRRGEGGKYTTSSTEFIVWGACKSGWAGSRVDVGPTPRYVSSPYSTTPSDELDSTHLATLLLTQGNTSPVKGAPITGYTDGSSGVLTYEYIECDAHEIVADSSGLTYSVLNYIGFADPPNDDDRNSGTLVQPEHSKYTVRSGGRGVRGTAARIWWDYQPADTDPGVIVKDVTIAVAIADRVLARASNGIPECRIRTDLRHLDLQIGDIITLDHPVYIGFKKDGADNTVIWEVTSVEPDIVADSPGVTLTLALLRHAHSRTLHAVNPPWWPPPTPPRQPSPLTLSSGEYVLDSTGNILYQ